MRKISLHADCSTCGIAQRSKLLFACGLILAAATFLTMHDPAIAQPNDGGGKFADPYVPKDAAKIRDLQEGVLTIAAFADDESTQDWRIRSIHAIWRDLSPRNPPLTRAQVDQLLSGNAREVLLELDDTTAAIFRGILEGILNGQPGLTLSPVGMLLEHRGTDYEPTCSVILTKANRILTARHCFKETDNPPMKVYFPFEGIRDLDTGSIDRCCEGDMDESSTLIDDLATVALTGSYNFLPLAIRGSDTSTNSGNPADIFGYGYNKVTLVGRGIQRKGNVELKTCSTCAEPAGANGHRLCFDFARDDTTRVGAGSHGNMIGDSGGPMWNSAVSPYSTIGVANSTDSACSEPGQEEGRYVNVTNPDFQQWLSGVFCSPPCPTDSSDDLAVPLLVSLGSSDTSCACSASTCSEPDCSIEHKFDVTPMAKKLIVSLNYEYAGGESSGAMQSELRMTLPDSLISGTTVNHERHVGVETWVVENPPEGTDYALRIRRVKGSPQYQLAVVLVSCPDLECWNYYIAQQHGRWGAFNNSAMAY